MTMKRIIKLTIKPLTLGLLGFSMIKLGVFNISGGGGLQTVYEVVSFSFVMSLCVGGMYFKALNNKRMILEYTGLMLIYYVLFYLAVFPALAAISPYLAIWADVIASLPVLLYCYCRTFITAKFLAWCGPHCYIQDKYLNYLARPSVALHKRGWLPNKGFTHLVNGLAFFRENGPLQHKLYQVIKNTHSTAFTLFCAAFTAASLIVDVFFSCWGDIYGLVNRVPFDGGIWATLSENGHFDFFLLWDVVQQGVAAGFPIALLGYVLLEKQEA